VHTTITCRICGGSAFAADWGGATCSECNSVSVLACPTREELQTFYETFNKTYYGGGRERGSKERQRRYAMAYLAAVGRHTHPGTLLDVGSSTSPFPDAAAAAGYRVTSLDFVRPPTLRDDVAFIQGEATPRPELRAGFETVTCFAVIEHSTAPRELASALVSYCRPSGVIVLTTPLVGDYWERNTAGRSAWFGPPEHLHLVSRRGMELLFCGAGCELVDYRRLELSTPRWVARYGIAAVEGLCGALMRAATPSRWLARRNKHVAHAAPIALYVFRKQLL